MQMQMHHQVESQQLPQSSVNSANARSPQRTANPASSANPATSSIEVHNAHDA